MTLGFNMIQSFNVPISRAAGSTKSISSKDQFEASQLSSSEYVHSKTSSSKQVSTPSKDATYMVLVRDTMHTPFSIKSS